MPRVGPDYTPQYRLHRQSGRAVVTLSGRDFMLGTYGSAESKAMYHQLISRWIAAGRKPIHDLEPAAPNPLKAPGKMTVAELVAAYIQYAQGYYTRANGRKSTEVDMLERATAPLVRLFGATAAADFGPTKLKLVRDNLMTGKRGPRVRTAINSDMHRIRRIWKWGASEELVDPSVYAALQTLLPLKAGRTTAPESKRIKPVPDAHVEAALQHMTSAVAAMVRLQRLTGCRGGELFDIRPRDINTTGAIWTYSPEAHKTAHHGHRRTIYFGPQAQAVLAPLLAGRPVHETLFDPRESVRRHRQHKLVKFLRRVGQKPTPRRTGRVVRDRYDTASYHRAVVRACDAAGVPRFHPHQLRHTAATLWRKQFGPDAALLMLGDRTPRMLEVYAERDTATAMKIASEVG